MNTLRKIPVKENSAKRKKEIKKEIMESLSILFMKSLVVELSPVKPYHHTPNYEEESKAYPIQ